MELFRVRLNCVDHYQAAPTSYDPPLFGKHGSTQPKDAPHVPVIRVFGATETGQKVCAHVHGALPYLYLEYHGSLEPKAVNAYIQQLQSSIDRALAISYRRNLYDGRAVFVGHISLVKGVPFFGYHVGYRYFLKVYMLNPLNMTRFADLLYQGAIMEKVMQPFESHLQYLLQWMCDYNLYGCAYIDCKTPKFRSPVPDYAELKNEEHKWHTRSIPLESISDPANFPRQSHCSIEVDICVSDIVNRLEVEARNMHADFLERFNPRSPDEKLVHSLAGLWRDETVRRKRRMGITDPSSSPFPPEVLVSMSADSRDAKEGDWIHEAEFRQMIQQLVNDERQSMDEIEVSFDNFVKPREDDKDVQTALQSVGDLFTENMQQTSFSSTGSDIYNNGRTNENPTHSLYGNDQALPHFDDEDFPYDSDENEARDQDIAHLGRLDDFDHKPVQFEANESKVDNVKRPAEIEDAVTFRSENNKTLKQPGKHLEGLSGHLSNGTPHNKRRLSSDSDKRPIYPSVIPAQDVKSSKKARVMFTDAVQRQHDMPDLVAAELNEVNNKTPPSSQQLSQTSIKANGSQGETTKGFKVTKNIPRRLSSLSQKDMASSDADSKPQNRTQPLSSGFSFTLHTPATRSASSASSKASQTPPSSQLLRGIQFLPDGFDSGAAGPLFCYSVPAPPTKEITEFMSTTGRPPVIYQDAYYSDEKDVPERARDYAGREFKLESTTTPFLPQFDAAGDSEASFGLRQPIVIDVGKENTAHRQRRYRCRLRNWDFSSRPPLYSEVESWLEAESNSRDSEKNPAWAIETPSNPDVQTFKIASQIDGPTQRNKHGFKFSQKKKSTSVRHATQYMSTMSLEVHVNTRDNFVPDPEQDEINCIFWCLKADDEDEEAPANTHGNRVGVLILSADEKASEQFRAEAGVEVEHQETELDLINRMVDIVRTFDPDILTGYEVHNGSWGYLIERGRLKFEYNLCDEFSRMKSQSHGRFGKDADRWGFNHTSTIRVTGRHMINIWRAMRSELNLLQYTMENVVFHLLHKRIPHFSFKDLTTWYRSGRPADLAKCLQYFISRVQLNLDILEANELIPRTSEQARLIGVDFFSVFSRGSQFKVESFMFRIAKPENFILVSPSRKQVGQQNALECLPLVMEPQSDFYNSPLLVLDFQSLYPSIMIAYNYCYSTCLGRITSWRGANKMGFADFNRQPQLLELVKDYINIAPNGIMFVKPEIRKSLLAKMLSDLLETRVMVKSGMKVDKDDKTLQQLLNNRQLALKLLANVTYGYTSASFSGRMPCSEIADSIVQTARETLEKTIALIHSMDKWGAEVVYGDTDSLFVYLKGRSKDEAFRIGNEIAKEVTNRHPRPIKLKFEKVYFPCVLLAKKRYVGYKYESPSQLEPEFDAKGIETVRRDGTPAEQKIEEKALKILFRTADLSQVKAYFQRQCMKIMLGKVSVQDFCYAREVKLGTYAGKGPPPPGALISTRRMLEDPRTEPQYGERVPYVVITGAPGARLIDRCVSPEDLLKREEVELDAEYYISKNLIPPLERIFNLVGANVRQWYDEMPKVQRIRVINAPPTTSTTALQPARKTLESYMQSSQCVVCRQKLPPSPAAADSSSLPLCSDCLTDASTSLFTLRGRLHEAQTRAAVLEKVCRSCSAIAPVEEVRCDSKDCAVFYSRIRARTKEKRVRAVVAAVDAGMKKGDSQW